MVMVGRVGSRDADQDVIAEGAAEDAAAAGVLGTSQDDDEDSKMVKLMGELGRAQKPGQ